MTVNRSFSLKSKRSFLWQNREGKGIIIEVASMEATSKIEMASMEAVPIGIE